jgi:hypothetical protein
LYSVEGFANAYVEHVKFYLQCTATYKLVLGLDLMIFQPTNYRHAGRLWCGRFQSSCGKMGKQW